MDSQDHKTTAISTGHEGHGVHICYRCGWPFPNPHPSARHRRAHKKVCGTIEGYPVIDDRHLVDSEDEHDTDEDEHTPSPNLVKKDAAGSGRVGEKSNKSEDDAYSDAVTHFSDSGISPQSEERFESVREVEKNTEPKEGDQTTDRTEQSNDPKTSEEITNPGPVVNNLSEGIIPTADPRNEAVSGQGADIQTNGDNLASITLDSEEGKVSNRTLTAAQTKEEGATNGAHSAERSISNETFKVPLVDETHEKEDDSVVLKEVSHSSTEEIRPVATIEAALVADTHEKEDDSVGLKEVSRATEEIRPIGIVGEDTPPQQTLDASEHSNAALEVSPNDEEVKPKIRNVGSFGASESDKCDMNGKENRNLESKESFYFDTAASFSYVDNALAPEDGQTIRAINKDVDRCEDKSDSEHLETGNEKSEGAPAEDKVVPDSVAVDTDSRNSTENNVNDVRVDSVGVIETVSKSKDNNEAITSEKTPEQSLPKEVSNAANDNSCTEDGEKASESIDSTEGTAKLDHGVDLASSPEILESKCVDVTYSGVDDSPPKSVGIASGAELDGNFLVSEIGLITLSSKEAVPQPSDYETSATGDDKAVTKENDGVSAIIPSGSSSDRADSMEANCGSVVSETNSQKPKTTTEEARPDKSDTFEPPSFMTLVQPGGEPEHAKAATEIETVQNNQQVKSDVLQAGWFPSLTNVVNESEGRKKNEEVIAKVTNWSPVKQHHGPLKTLLNEVKSPNTKQVESESKDNNGGQTTVGHITKDQDTNKDVEEWNSPARYPIEIKKEKKKKGRSYWVPFVCCSSAHRDL